MAEKDTFVDKPASDITLVRCSARSFRSYGFCSSSSFSVLLSSFSFWKFFLLHFLFERKRSKRKVGRDKMAKICSSRAKPVIKGTVSLLSFITGFSIANTFYECNTVNRPYRFLTLFRNKFLHAIYVKGRKKLPLLTTLPLIYNSPVAALRNLLNLMD